MADVREVAQTSFRPRNPEVLSYILPETMKQFGCSVFDGPFVGIISRVFDARLDFLARYFFGSSIFDQKYLILLFQVRFSIVFIFEIHGYHFW